jgi:lipoprotein-anchoring transpeptidase ErfK/SrfK
VFQQWKVDMPWAGAGQVVIANGGDVAKEAGLLPQDILTPSTTNVRVWPTGTVELIVDTGEGERWIDVDLTKKVVRAMLDDTELYSAPTIIGLPNWITPAGEYEILRRVANETMDSETIGIPRDDPYGYYLTNVYFTQYFTGRGHSIHYNYWEPWWKFGVAAGSHGCLGLHYGDAEFFWNYASVGTRLVVHY